MARIRMIKMLAGPAGSMHPGKQYDVTDDLALALVEAGACELLEDATAPAAEIPDGETRVIETATQGAPENAARRTRGSRG